MLNNRGWIKLKSLIEIGGPAYKYCISGGGGEREAWESPVLPPSPQQLAWASRTNRRLWWWHLGTQRCPARQRKFSSSSFLLPSPTGQCSELTPSLNSSVPFGSATPGHWMLCAGICFCTGCLFGWTGHPLRTQFEFYLLHLVSGWP